MCVCERERERERQTDRQMERQIQRERFVYHNLSPENIHHKEPLYYIHGCGPRNPSLCGPTLRLNPFACEKNSI